MVRGKLLDVKKGRVLGLNAVDFAFIVAVILLASLIGYRCYLGFLAAKRVYPGTAIYNAVYDAYKASCEGFMLRAYVKGRFIENNSRVELTGLVTYAAAGKLKLLIEEDGREREVVVGGAAAYYEDVAADWVELKPLSRSVIIVDVRPCEFETIEDYISFIKSIAANLSGRYGLACLKVKGELILSSPGLKPSPTTYFRIMSSIGRRIKLGAASVSIYENVLFISFRDYRLKEVKKLAEILADVNVTYDRVYVDSTRLFIGTEREISYLARKEVLFKAKRIKQVNPETLYIVPRWG